MPPSAKLRSKADFESIYARGSRRFDDAYLGLRVRPNDVGRPRLGLAVAVKTAGSAVRRNRLRRVIRESFRLEQHALPAVDIIVAARSASRNATSAQLRASLANFWNRIKAQCANSSAR
ncbi:MAG: ribonuclease P protein component [Hyphomonadaceae bacterium]|nr:ribonuclease P protein component [Hyphomonadaceae bacterium]